MASQDMDRDDVAASRRQLVVRVAVVAGLIVVLLAGLLIFEREQISSPSVAADPKPLGRAVAPIGNAIAVSAPALSEEVSRAIREAPDVTQVALASMSAPAAVPEETFDPTIPREGEPQSAPAKRSPPRVAASQPVARGGDRLVVEGGRQSPVAVVSPKPIANAAPLSQPPAPVAVLPPVAPATPSPNGYLIQLGVFNNRGNAEELRSKLALAGIPSQVETRVQLGPFKTREEALDAQQKLRVLGMTQGLLVPPRKP